MYERDTNSTFESDWKRIDRLTDEDIDTTDIPPLTESQFARAVLRVPKEGVELCLDADLIAWFKGQGAEYDRHINAVLRVYVEAHGR